MRLAALLALSLSLAAPVAAAPPTPPASIEQPPLVRRPAFPAEFPVGRIVDEKLVAGLRFAVPQPADALKMPVQEPTEISIMGDAAATEEQMLAYLLRRNAQPKLTGTPAQLVHAYYEEAEREGIRPDVALAQAFKETGFFAYGGDVSWEQNNFCGLGATGNGAKGLSFPDIRTGVRAHIQHLLAYASKELPTVPIVDPRYSHIRTNRPDVYGRLTRWTDLNGVWAVPGRNYGQEILLIRDAARAPDGSDAALHAANLRLMQAADADAYIYRGLVYLHRSAYDDALADFTAAQKRDVKRPAPYLGIALVHAAAGHSKEAHAAYERYLKLAPDDATARYNYGLVLLETGADDKAAAALRGALAANPQNADAMNALGLAQLHSKDYRGAWHTWADAARIAPENADILINQILLAASCKDAAEKKEKKKRK
ncbi:MAG: tetratricopeptide repeat protein [Selenomonas artemidis]